MNLNKLFLAVLYDFAKPDGDGIQYFTEEGYTIFLNGWPEGIEKFEQDSTWSYQAVDTDGEDVCEFEFEGHYMNEYDDRQEVVTFKEYSLFLDAHPNWEQELDKLAETNMALIAEKNKQIAALVDEVTELADAAGLDLQIDVGQHGSLDPYGSRWNSSMC